jgi:prevent-host-death family protein
MISHVERPTCGINATICHMTTIASRDLRNHTADVLRQVAEGTPVTITINGTPVADVIPHRAGRRSALSRAELRELLSRQQADTGLREDLARLGSDTDDLGPVS